MNPATSAERFSVPFALPGAANVVNGARVNVATASRLYENAKRDVPEGRENIQTQRKSSASTALG